MYVRKEYSIIALAESLKRGGDQRKARFERSLSGMTLEMMGKADRGPGEAISSVSFARDLEVGSQAGGQAIVSSSVLLYAEMVLSQILQEAALEKKSIDDDCPSVPQGCPLSNPQSRRTALEVNQ